MKVDKHKCHKTTATSQLLHFAAQALSKQLLKVSCICWCFFCIAFIYHYSEHQFGMFLLADKTHFLAWHPMRILKKAKAKISLIDENTKLNLFDLKFHVGAWKKLLLENKKEICIIYTTRPMTHYTTILEVETILKLLEIKINRKVLNFVPSRITALKYWLCAIV